MCLSFITSNMMIFENLSRLRCTITSRFVHISSGTLESILRTVPSHRRHIPCTVLACLQVSLYIYKHNVFTHFMKICSTRHSWDRYVQYLYRLGLIQHEYHPYIYSNADMWLTGYNRGFCVDHRFSLSKSEINVPKLFNCWSRHLVKAIVS